MSGFCQRLVNGVIRGVLWLALSGAAAAMAMPTPWELDPEATPRYAETVAWCQELAAASDQVACGTFGRSPQGRGLPLVIWDPDGLADPVACHEAGRLVLLIQGCIHAGETCGKDAGMTLVRDLALRGGPPGVTVLLIPIFNVDGHERFGPYNRINQNGPREMGWRTTAQNLDLNRDHLKADAPEMQAWLRLWDAWQPHFLVDIHATNGADYQYPLTYVLELRGNLDPDLTAWLEDYLAAVSPPLAAAGYPLAPYVVFREWHDPRSGLQSWVAGPRFSQGYAATRNRPGLLVEAHMLKPYPVRVAATRALLDQTLAFLATEAGTLRALTAAADRHAASAAFRAEPFPLAWQLSDESEPFTFLGVAYEQRTSALSGGEYFVYHGDRPEVFTVPYYNQPLATTSARLPEAYLIPPQWQEVIARLALHGVRMARLREEVALTVRTWRFLDPRWEGQPVQGRHPFSYELAPVTMTATVPAGTVVIDLAQPAARLVAHALEPAGPDAFVRWGFFDAVMTRVEYVESYVIERLMREMVAADPGLLAELKERKTGDPLFATNPRAIRNWFYERTAYHDQQAFLYPVLCLDERTVVDRLPLEH
jgi:hypothetical protein